jgi:hypothetical protein
MKKLSVLSALILMICFLFAGTAYPADEKGSAVAGKVVGRDGRPLAGVSVEAMLSGGEYKEGYEWFEVKTKPDGTFVLKGLYPGTYYRIVCDGGQCNDQKERIRSLPPGETLKLENDFVLFFSPFKVSSENVIQDLRTGLEWAPVPMTINYDGAVTYAKSSALPVEAGDCPRWMNFMICMNRVKGMRLDWAFENRYPKAWASDLKSPSKRWLVRFSGYKVYTELWGQQSEPCDDCRVLPVRASKR